MRVYDVATGQLLAIRKRGYALLDCAFLWDGSTVLSVGLEKRLMAWDLYSHHEAQCGAHDEPIRCVEAHLVTRQIFTGSWDRTVSAWDPRQGASPVSVTLLDAKVFCLDVGVDTLVVGASDRHVHIYDVRKLTKPIERRESSLKHQLRAVQVGLGQRGYVSSSIEGRVAVEYFHAGENERSRYAFKCHRTKASDGSEQVHPVNAVAFHPVYGTFATGGSDGSVCTWDGEAKKRLARLNQGNLFESSVSTLGFSCDGSMLAVGVSYTFERGDLPVVAAPQLVVQRLNNAEILPKSQQAS